MWKSRGVSYACDNVQIGNQTFRKQHQDEESDSHRFLWSFRFRNRHLQSHSLGAMDNLGLGSASLSGYSPTLTKLQM